MLTQDNTESKTRLWGRRATIWAVAAASAGLLWLLAALCLTPGPALGQEAGACDTPGTLRIVPGSASVQVGQAVTVEVWLEGAGNYYGLDLRLAFNPTRVRVPAGRVTPLWEVLDSANHFAIKNEADNISGTVWYAVTNMNPAEPFTGTGRICAIGFSGLAPGETTLHFTYAKGSTRGGEGLYPAAADGSIVVSAPQRRDIYLPVVGRQVGAG
jgi:hypothetical protein